MADIDTLHLELTDEEIKDILRRGFAKGGWGPEKFDVLDDFALMVRGLGFAAFLEFLKFAAESRHGHPPSAT